MITHFKGFLATAAFAAVALTFAPAAHATAELMITDGMGNSVDIVDNMAGTCVGAVTGCTDANGAVNVVTFVGTIGTWSLNVSTGSSHGALAGTDLDLNSVNNTTAAGTLTIQFSDTGFASPGPYDFSVGGTSSGSGPNISFSEYAGAAKFALTNQIGSTLTFTTSPFSGMTAGAAVGTALTEKAVLTFTGAGGTSFDAQLSPVPEPTSVALFGSALLFIGSALRRKVRRG